MAKPASYIAPAVHAEVRQRDGRCMAEALGFTHFCRDEWGHDHMPTAISHLTCEHVWRDYAVKGKRPPSDREHLVAVCYWINVEFHPTASMRGAFRLYLDSLYPPPA